MVNYYFFTCEAYKLRPNQCFNCDADGIVILKTDTGEVTYIWSECNDHFNLHIKTGGITKNNIISKTEYNLLKIQHG